MVAGAPTASRGDVVAGRYRIEGELGAGGFGAVFRATNLQLGREVALKVLLPELVENPEMEKRFSREAELARRLEHPNTVRLLDFGRSAEGVPFIAFELLKGRSLDTVIRHGPMPAPRVARIAAQVLKSLMDAHQHGIVHRDIKPANVFLCDFSGEQDFVKVLDFGIAKAPTGGAGTTVGLTRAGHAIGTPHYMAPEQVAGAPVGPSTDLYALGLVMAEMVTGRTVFDGASAMMICMEQLSPAPVPLSPDVMRSPLGQVIQRATQKAVERRYASAAEMLRDVEAAGAGTLQSAGAPLVTPPPSPAFAYAPTGVVAVPMPPPIPAAPQPYGPPPYVAATQPYGVQQPSTVVRTGSGCSPVVIGLLVVGALLLLGGIGVVVAVVVGGGLLDRPSASTPTSGGGNLQDLTGDEVRSRLESSGFSINSTSVNEAGQFSTYTYAGSNGSQTAVVILYLCQDESMAGTIADNLRPNFQGTVLQDEGVVLAVMTAPREHGVERKLVETLTR